MSPSKSFRLRDNFHHMILWIWCFSQKKIMNISIAPVRNSDFANLKAEIPRCFELGLRGMFVETMESTCSWNWSQGIPDWSNLQSDCSSCMVVPTYSWKDQEMHAQVQKFPVPHQLLDSKISHDEHYRHYLGVGQSASGQGPHNSYSTSTWDSISGPSTHLNQSGTLHSCTHCHTGLATQWLHITFTEVWILGGSCNCLTYFNISMAEISEKASAGAWIRSFQARFWSICHHSGTTFSNLLFYSSNPIEQNLPFKGNPAQELRRGTSLPGWTLKK